MKTSQKMLAAVILIVMTGCGAGVTNAANSSAAGKSGEPTTTPTSYVDPTQLHQAASASAFTDSVGVNTHFTYTDSTYYKKTPQVIQALQLMKVRHIRDGLHSPAVAPNIYKIQAELFAAGVGTDLVVPNPAAGVSLARMQSLLLNSPSAESIEAPNEFDQAGDPHWAANLRAYLPTVYALGKISGIPVYAPSLTQINSYPTLGDVSQSMDFNNYHAYWGGRNPENGGWGGPDAHNHYYGSLAYDFDELQIDGPNKPVVMTETGYLSNGTSQKKGNLPEAVEAIYEPRLLLHCWNSGIKRTYIYELMDEPSSAVGYGLLHSDLTPRPAYNAIVSLMSLVAEDKTKFVAGKLGYTLSGNTSGVETTLLQKSDGSFWLALWIPSAIYDVNALTPISVPMQAVELTVLGGPKVINSWTFDGTGQANVAPVNSDTTNFAVGSGITLLKIE